MSACRHFNGSFFLLDSDRNDPCAVGADPVAIAGGRKPGWANRLPCIHTAVTACPLREEWSEAELVQQRRDRDRAAAENIRCIDALPWGESDAGDSGTVPCPKCGGSIRWARHQSNGHMHAACDTPGCFGMIQ